MDYRAGAGGVPCPAQMFNLTLIIRNFANGGIWCEDNSVDSVVSLKKNLDFQLGLLKKTCNLGEI